MEIKKDEYGVQLETKSVETYKDLKKIAATLKKFIPLNERKIEGLLIPKNFYKKMKVKVNDFLIK